MKINVEVNTETIRTLILDHLREKLGTVSLSRDDVKIEVKSKQNYRVHEWETGDLRVRYEGEV